MMPALAPAVTVADVPVPLWARLAIERAEGRLFRPDRILAVRVNFLPLAALPSKWARVSFLVDGREAAAVFSMMSYLWQAVDLPPGWHAFGVETGVETAPVEPIGLEVRRGTVLLVEVQPDNYRWLRWLSPKPPSVSYRILPAGFAHNGRWGRRWSRRLGWDAQGAARAQDAREGRG